MQVWFDSAWDEQKGKSRAENVTGEGDGQAKQKGKGKGKGKGYSDW